MIRISMLLGVVLLPLNFLSCGLLGSDDDDGDNGREIAFADYFPLDIGYTWTYDLYQPTKTGTMVRKVIGMQAEWYVLEDTYGDEVDTLFAAVRDSVIVIGGNETGTIEDRIYLLKAPVEVGTTWRNPGAPAVVSSTITSVDSAEIVGAGIFLHAIVVEETDADVPDLKRAWKFVPKVGQITFEILGGYGSGKWTALGAMPLASYDL